MSVPKMLSIVLMLALIALVRPQHGAAQGPPPLPGCMGCTGCPFGSGGLMCGFGFSGWDGCGQEIHEETQRCVCLVDGNPCGSATLASGELEGDATRLAIRTLTTERTLPSDGPFFFVSGFGGTVTLQRKCDGVVVARLSRRESGFVLFEVSPDPDGALAQGGGERESPIAGQPDS